MSSATLNRPLSADDALRSLAPPACIAECPESAPAATITVGARIAVSTAHSESKVDWTGKAAVLIALLGLEGQAPRQRVAALLWPDSEQRQARNNLRTLVHRINQRIGGELLQGADHLRFDPAQTRVVLHDSEALLASLDSGGPERCELLAEADVGKELGEELQAWLESAQLRLRRIQLAGLCESLAEAMARKRYGQAVALARACVQLEPLSEQWHRQLMDALVRSGDRAAALAAYEECKAMLRHELGVLPDLQTRTVHLRILQGQAHVLQQAQAQAQAQAPETAGLTPLGGAARYPLVEREAVLGEVQAALGQGQHVVIQGEPGVGKTRLLRQVAARGVVEQVSIRSGAKREPYASIAQLLQEIQPRRALRIGVPEQIELARLAPLAFPGVKASNAALSVLHLHAALRHWLAALGEAGVELLVLDDLHHADTASQAAIGALLGSAEGSHPGPLLLLAHRSGEIDAALRDAEVAAQARRQAHGVALQRLTLKGVQALLRAMEATHHAGASDDSMAEALAPKLLQRTGGNPLFVIELAQQTLEPGGDAGAANLEALLKARLAGCSAPAQQLAAVAAVAAEDFCVDLAAAVTGQPALALMPAWTELQQRGLFVDHGLAHELLRDATLESTPLAIRQALHRQVAAYLQSQGQRGTSVLRHWLAGDDRDRALPHAVHQLHASGAAGLSTVQQELELLALLERVSDATLLDNLWLSAEIRMQRDCEDFTPAQWTRLGELSNRVANIVKTASGRAWLTYERACWRMLNDRDTAGALALFAAAAGQVPADSMERIHIDLAHAVCALTHGTVGRELAVRTHLAVERLPQTIEYARLRWVSAKIHALYQDPADVVRVTAAAMRAASRRGDRAAKFNYRHELAKAFSWNAMPAAAHRHFGRLLAEGSPVHSHDQPAMRSAVGLAALSCGDFTAALQHLEALPPSQSAKQQLALALLWTRLGRVDIARQHLAGLETTHGGLGHRMARLRAMLQAELDELDGIDPLPGLRQSLTFIKSCGGPQMGVKLLEWQIMRRAQAPHERLEAGHQIIAEVGHAIGFTGALAWILINVAEDDAATGGFAHRELALRAASLLRRGRTSVGPYLPSGLVRCAKLLDASEPAMAAAFRHAARRWVERALQNVPLKARESFMSGVAVNRLLLSDGTPRP